MGAPAFELRDVTVVLGGQTALQRLSLSISAGEALAFIGPSGAGKTTALRVLNRAAAPERGSVRAAGLDLAEVGAAHIRRLRSTIGVIPQDLGLVPNLRVSQNVLAGRVGQQGFWCSLRALAWPPRAELERVYAILEHLGIPEKMFQRTDSLSGGERQRVAIARSLYQGARTLLADEPLSALDPLRARETLSLLIQVARENHMTLVLSLHSIDLARELVPRLIGLKRGRMLFDRPASEVPDAALDELYELEER